MSSNLYFKTRARIIQQLGEQLIRNEATALLELVKNSYDADASKCTIRILHPTDTDKGEIIISDNGEGMDYNTLSTVWLEIGTSFKDDLKKDPLKTRSPKYHRLRLGEKGIGRLGVHRLGREIEIITKTRNSLECVLRVDWETIEKSRYIEDIPVEIIKRDPEEFLSGSGTKITIRRLKTPWDRRMARDCARSIT